MPNIDFSRIHRILYLAQKCCMQVLSKTLSLIFKMILFFCPHVFFLFNMLVLLIKYIEYLTKLMCVQNVWILINLCYFDENIYGFLKFLWSCAMHSIVGPIPSCWTLVHCCGRMLNTVTQLPLWKMSNTNLLKLSNICFYSVLFKISNIGEIMVWNMSNFVFEI